MGAQVFAAQLEETGQHQRVCCQPRAYRHFVPAHPPVLGGVPPQQEKMDLWGRILQDNKILLQPEFVRQHRVSHLYKCVQVPGYCPPNESDGKNNCDSFCDNLSLGLDAGEYSVSSGHVLLQNICKESCTMLRYHQQC